MKDPTGATAQLVIGGLTEDPTDAPGPFGVYVLATTHTMQRSISTGTIEILTGEESRLLSNIEARASSRYSAEHDDQSSRSSKGIFLQGGRRQLREIVRWHREIAELGQHYLDRLLEVKRSKRNFLRSKVQRAAKSELARAAAEGFFGGEPNDVRVIVLLGNMRENHMAGAAIK